MKKLSLIFDFPCPWDEIDMNQKKEKVSEKATKIEKYLPTSTTKYSRTMEVISKYNELHICYKHPRQKMSVQSK